MAKPSFEAFYHANVRRIYAFVYFRVGADKPFAEDLVQDIFIKAFEAFDRYDPTISQSAWIYMIARNHLINEMAKRRPGVPLEEVEDSILVSIDARERLALRDDEQRLLQSISLLDKEDAKLIRMKYLEGWKFEELAEIFEKTPATLRVQASRALKRLKSKIKL
jgi:RNA polymerase sigma-70 factor (ECF subfamily)